MHLQLSTPILRVGTGDPLKKHVSLRKTSNIWPEYRRLFGCTASLAVQSGDPDSKATGTVVLFGI